MFFMAVTWRNRSFVCKCFTAGKQTLSTGDKNKHLDIGNAVLLEKLKISFATYRDTLNRDGGWDSVVTPRARCRPTWKEIRKYSIFTGLEFSLKLKDKVCKNKTQILRTVTAADTTRAHVVTIVSHLS